MATQQDIPNCGRAHIRNNLSLHACSRRCTRLYAHISDSNESSCCLQTSVQQTIEWETVDLNALDRQCFYYITIDRSAFSAIIADAYLNSILRYGKLFWLGARKLVDTT